MVEWRCQCGHSEPEPGDGTGLNRIKAHVLNQGQKEPGTHRVLGAWSDGEQVVWGPSKVQAVQSGIIAEEGKPGKAKPDEERSPSPSLFGRPKSNIGAVVPFRRLVVAPSLEGYYALYRAWAARTPRLGEPERRQLLGRWSADDAGMAHWLHDLVEQHAIEHLDLLFGLDRTDPAYPQHHQQALAALGMIQAMDHPDRAPLPWQPAGTTTPSAGTGAPPQALEAIASALVELTDRVARLEAKLGSGHAWPVQEEASA